MCCDFFAVVGGFGGYFYGVVFVFAFFEVVGVGFTGFGGFLMYAEVFGSAGSVVFSEYAEVCVAFFAEDVSFG